MFENIDYIYFFLLCLKYGGSEWRFPTTSWCMLLNIFFIRHRDPPKMNRFEFFCTLMMFCFYAMYIAIGQTDNIVEISITGILILRIYAIIKQRIRFKQTIALNSSGYCSICIEDIQIGEKIILLKCKHIFHTECLIKWGNFGNKCPNCNNSL